MIIAAINTTDSNMVQATSSQSLFDKDRNFLATVEVDHVKNNNGVGCYIRLQDVGYRSIDHNEAVRVGERLHEQWMANNGF